MSDVTQEKTSIPAEETSVLDKRRPLIYTFLLIFQILSLVSNIVIIPASKDSNTAISFDTANLINLIFALLLTAANLVFLWYFIKKRIIFWITAVLFFISIALSFISAVFDLHATNFPAFRLLFGITTFVSIAVICFTFFIAVRDIFGEKLKIGSALLGAANIYLLIGSGFAFVYGFINIMMPGCMVPIAEMNNLFNTCVINSTYILGGMDLPDNNYAGAVKNLMMFESIFAHLFAVFIVGRLLAK